MAYRGDTMDNKKLFVGNLEAELEQQDLQSLFEEFGAIANIWIARKPPGFAFVSFENSLDARDAAAKMDGSRFQGKRLRVEMARASSKSGGGRGGKSAMRRDRSRSVEEYVDRRPQRSYRPTEFESARFRSRSPSHERMPGYDRTRSRYANSAEYAPYSAHTAQRDY